MRKLWFAVLLVAACMLAPPALAKVGLDQSNAATIDLAWGFLPVVDQPASPALNAGAGRLAPEAGDVIMTKKVKAKKQRSAEGVTCVPILVAGEVRGWRSS